MFAAEQGTPLKDLLFGFGVEFPCGGRGRCKGCRIKVVAGSLPLSEEDRARLSPGELAAGWRLACRARAQSNLRIELAQWESAILSDDSSFAFTPGKGFGAAVDLGTTTIVAQLLDLQTGRVLAVQTALNAQARHGSDIMSRVEFATLNQGQLVLEKVVRDQIGEMVGALLASAGAAVRDGAGPGGDQLSSSPRQELSLGSIVLVGNTVMHHLFCGISVQSLAHYPFESTSPGLKHLGADTLGWDLPGNPPVYFLPCLGGFVGSDILAGVVATRLHERESLAMLIDLGTNGEIVLGNCHRLLCAGTAAGPAFEGARIAMGMRAATGAISEVEFRDGRVECRVLGGSPPRGICGSGLVDAAAVGLDMGWILPNGKLADGRELVLAPPVTLVQRDIRELQLAKGAIAAGARILLEQWGALPCEVEQVFLAGAFGNYINQANARRIGLLEFDSEKIVPAGNTALLGAKIALFSRPHHDISYPAILERTRHVSLNEAPGFEDVYAEKMGFPPRRS